MKGRSPRQPFLPTIGLYHAANDGALVVIPAIFPILIAIEGFGLDYMMIGLLTSIGMAVTTVGQVVIGSISDARDPGRMMAGGQTILVLGLLLMTRAYDFTSLCLSFIIVRTGASFYHPVCISWISRRFEGRELDGGMGFQSAWGDAGVVVALVTTGFIALATWWWLPVTIWAVLNGAAVLLGISRSHDTSVPRPKPRSAGVEGVLHQLGRIWYAVIPFMVCGAVYIVTITFGPLLVTDRLGHGASTAGLMIALWIGAGVISAYYFGKASAAVGRKWVIVGSFLLAAVMCVLISMTLDLFLLAVWMALFGLAFFVIFPGIFSLISDITGKVGQGKLFGWLFALHVVGGSVIAYVCGLTATLFGIESVFLVCALLLFGTIVCFLWYKSDDIPAAPSESEISS